MNISRRQSSFPFLAIIFNLVFGGFASDPIARAASCTTPSFAPAGTLGTGSQPVSVIVSDLNADGRDDIVWVSQVSANVSVQLGVGNGAFQAVSNYACGSSPSSVVAVDFNNDGKIDLAVSDTGSTNIAVLLGNGNGTFQAAVSYPAFDSSQFIAAGDFNRDGKVDLVVANRLAYAVSVLFGNGDGTFQMPVNYDVGIDPLSLAVGDFNNDGNLDLAVANASLFDDTASSISILMGSTNGTFQTPADYFVGSSSRSIVVGDFNGDGKPDLAVANYGGFNTNNVFTNSSVSVLIGNGNGTFQPAVNYTAGEGPVSLALADVNNDSQSDLIIANSRSTNVSVLPGNTNGTFQTATNFGAGASPQWVAAGDFNGDGQTDLTVANASGVLLLLNTTIHLDARRSGSTITVSWPYSATGFVLESVSSLSVTNWSPAAETPTSNSGCWEIVVPANTAERYFRLHRN